DFDAKPLWARFWVISAGVLKNFLFASVVIAMVALIWGPSNNPTTRVAIAERGALSGAAAPLAAIPTGAELSAVGGELVESWNDVQERLNDAGAGALTLSFVDGQEVTLQLPSSATERLQVIDHINF